MRMALYYVLEFSQVSSSIKISDCGATPFSFIYLNFKMAAVVIILFDGGVTIR